MKKFLNYRTKEIYVISNELALSKSKILNIQPEVLYVSIEKILEYGMLSGKWMRKFKPDSKLIGFLIGKSIPKLLRNLQVELFTATIQYNIVLPNTFRRMSLKNFIIIRQIFKENILLNTCKVSSSTLNQ